MSKIPIILCLLAALVLSLSFPPFPALSTLAAGEYTWNSVPLPAEGAIGKWALAAGSDIKRLTVAADGALYCYANPAGSTDTLFKSADSGLTWASAGRVKDIIVEIAACPQDAATVYYATASSLYRSTDAGANFIPLPPGPGGAGAGNISIRSIDVVRMGNSNLVAVGTADADAGQYGGVYLLDESSPAGVWVNTAIGNFDVCRVVFSPDYAGDRVLIAIGTDETDLVVRQRVNDGAWAQFIADARVAGTVPAAASLAFPDDFQTTGVFFIATDTGAGTGDVFRIERSYAPGVSAATALGIAGGAGLTVSDITGLSITGATGAATILVGLAQSAMTCISADGGQSWRRARKPPSGQSTTSVVIAPGGAGSGRLFAATCGTESGFSVSEDGGDTWNTVSLVDSKISNLIDMALVTSSQPETIFLITQNSASLKYSLWRTQNAGGNWQRVCVSGLPGISSFTMIRAVPGTGGLILAGDSSGNPALWNSADLGQSYTVRIAPFNIDSLIVLDGDRHFIGGQSGVKVVFAGTANGGLSYTDAVEVGVAKIMSIALSPRYLIDRTILVGNASGQVYQSIDGGASFTQLGQNLPLTLGVGRVSVAFDKDYGASGAIYAATDSKTTSTSKDRIFRYSRQSNRWQSIHGSLPVDAVIGQLAENENGILYAVNGQGVAAADGKGGVLRSLNPSAGTAFELMLRGLEETATLKGLWLSGRRLWTFDTKNTVLLTVTDGAAAPVVLKSPPDKAEGLSAEVRLEWQAVSGVTEYEWQLSEDTAFTSLPTAHTGATQATFSRASGLKLSTVYYWRVRATKPCYSLWSENCSFTTASIGTDAIARLVFPDVGGRTGVSPVFLWQAVPGAEKYELLIAAEPTFSNPCVNCTGEKALPSNAWQCDVSLEYGTAYFWKVRAWTSAITGEWSAVSVFTTEAAPVHADAVLETVRSEPPATQQVTVITQEPQTQILPPTAVIQLTVPDWALFTGLGFLGSIVLLFAVLLVLVVKRKV